MALQPSPTPQRTQKLYPSGRARRWRLWVGINPMVGCTAWRERNAAAKIPPIGPTSSIYKSTRRGLYLCSFGQCNVPLPSSPPPPFLFFNFLFPPPTYSLAQDDWQPRWCILGLREVSFFKGNDNPALLVRHELKNIKSVTLRPYDTVRKRRNCLIIERAREDCSYISTQTIEEARNWLVAFEALGIYCTEEMP